MFASDEFDAEAVWKQGSDLRVVVSNKEIREKVEDEIGQMEEEESNDDGDSDEAPEMDATDARPAPEMMSPSEKMRAKREYEGYAWHRVANGQLGEIVDQPTGAEYIPLRDQFDVQPDEEEWKTRAAGFEIRADITGLYKVAGGKMTRLRTGNYGDPVISPNGRWVIVRKTTDDEGESLVRYNLITNREYPVAFNGEGNLYPRCYVPALGKFLLAAGYYEEGYYDRDDDENDGSPSARRFYSMDPETGVLLPVSGDARPLSDQTFRSLQPTGKGNQFWAAMPSKARGETVVGVFDSRIFRFQPVLKLPKINFDSMDMWVDESENKVYFVYSGHLLRVPLKMPQLR